MNITQGDIATFLKQLIPLYIPHDYDIDQDYLTGTNEKELRESITIFRDYLYNLCDCIIKDNELSSTPKKGKFKFYDETTLSVEYPFINNVRSTLINIGFSGELENDNTAIVIDNWDLLSIKRSLNKNSTTKISTAQMLKTLQFLETTGFAFEGIDLNVKRLDLSSVDSIKITYPSNHLLLLALKTMGIAQMERSNRNNDDILLRCDYRALSSNPSVIKDVLSDYTYGLSDALKDTVRSLHDGFIKLGMTIDVEQRMMNYHFIYSYKRKRICRFSVSAHLGYRFVVKPTKTDKYQDFIETLPNILKTPILKGYGCNKKSGTGHGNCENGCAGICFNLDEKMADKTEHIISWISKELNS